MFHIKFRFSNIRKKGEKTIALPQFNNRMPTGEICHIWEASFVLREMDFMRLRWSEEMKHILMRSQDAPQILIYMTQIFCLKEFISQQMHIFDVK